MEVIAQSDLELRCQDIQRRKKQRKEGFNRFFASLFTMKADDAEGIYGEPGFDWGPRALNRTRLKCGQTCFYIVF